MKKYLIAPVLLASMLISAPSFSKVEIEWKEYKEYSDIRPSNDSRERFAKNTFKRIEKYMVRLMKDLPEDQTLSLVVTDLDLAGRVQFGGTPISLRPGFARFDSATNDIRVIDRADFPAMEFSYELTDASGNVIRSGNADLKDLGFQDRIVAVPRSDRLRYEKQMLREWFYKEFRDLKVESDA